MPEVTVTEHMYATQKMWSPKASGEFTSLLHDLILSAKIISRNVSHAGLVDILGGTGQINVQGEYVQKLDDFAHNTLVYRMKTSGAICALGSEEMADPMFISSEESKGSYIIFFDPLDGSANIDVNISIGTIFSIYKRPQDDGEPCAASILRPGVEQVAAGYFLYGTSTMLVYTTGHGVHGFTMDPSVGEFLLSHPDIKIPKKGKIYSVNYGNYDSWDDASREAVDSFSRPVKGKSHSYRYVGSLVADFHRTLLAGGVFMYPPDKQRPKGKLRLVYEAAPMAFIVEQAGGKATDGINAILGKQPEDLHERTPLFIGSPAEVDQITEIFCKHGS